MRMLLNLRLFSFVVALCFVSTAHADDADIQGTNGPICEKSGVDEAARAQACSRILALKDLSVSEKVKALANRAAALANGEAALADLDAAILLDPKNPDLFNQRSLRRAQSGDLAGATLDEGQVIALRPDAAAPRRARAVLLLKQSRNEDALIDLDALVRLDPGDGWALLYRGIARWRSLDMTKSSPGTTPDSAFRQLQQEACREVRTECADVTLALADLDRAIALLPADGRAIAFVNRALIFDDRGETQKALADLDNAVHLHPDDAGILIRRSRLRWKAADKEGARTDLDAVLAKSPHDAGLLVERAEMRKATGDPAGAAVDLDAAMALPLPQQPVLGRIVALSRALGRSEEPGMGSQISGLKVAQVNLSPGRSGDEGVAILFDADATRQLALFTSLNIGRVAEILVADKVVATPRILTPITGGSIVINGGFSHQAAFELAARVSEQKAAVTMRILRE